MNRNSRRISPEKTILVIMGGLAGVLFALSLLIVCIYEIGHWRGKW